MSKKQPQEVVKVGAVVNAIAIIRALIAQRESTGVNALARATGVSPSSCFNILKTLVAENLVEFDVIRKTYAPGARLHDLAPRDVDGRRAYAKCAPLLHLAAERHRATVALWRMTAAERLVLVGFEDSAMATRIHMTVGHRLPMLAGAVGRCVASVLDLSEAAIAQRFATLRWDNPPNLKSYLRQVGEARERGWAVDDGAFLAGVSTVAAPMLYHSGQLAFVLSATMFLGQQPKSENSKIGDVLKTLAKETSILLAL